VYSALKQSKRQARQLPSEQRGFFGSPFSEKIKRQLRTTHQYLPSWISRVIIQCRTYSYNHRAEVEPFFEELSRSEQKDVAPVAAAGNRLETELN
jgi:hypothetical protein